MRLPISRCCRSVAATAVALAAALVVLLAHAVPAVAAVDEADLLPVDDAFALSAHATDARHVALDWRIAEGYYLYRHRIKVVATDAATLGALALPKGDPHDDEFFGRVETYRRHLGGQLPVDAGAAGRVALKVSYQGCADVGVCYPPQTRVLRVALPATTSAGGKAGAADTTGAPATAADDGFARLGAALGRPAATPLAAARAGGDAGVDALPLPPEQAFGFEAIAADGNTLLLRFTPARGYYLYRDKTRFELAGAGIALGTPRWPPGQRHRDEHFGEVVVYFDQVEVPLPLHRDVPDAGRIRLTTTFQGCQTDGICYPPMTRTVEVALPAGAATPRAGATEAANASTATSADTASLPSSSAIAASGAAEEDRGRAQAPIDAVPASSSEGFAEDSRLAALLSGPSRGWALLLFFASGLGLAFTPCVYPMIPILTGLITGAGTRLGTARALWLSLVYVLASALVFTAAGVIAGLLGANLQAAFQTPWVLILFALLFVALALSSFGLYELQLPAALRARLGGLSDRQRGGSLAGVAAMGALSTLIVGPCVAPPLAAAALYISQSHDPVFGGLALFVLAMGMGAPLLAFGAAAGRGMPTSGPWMTTVQRVFGFVFLALAVWMLSRIVPGPVTLALFGVLALAGAASAWAGARHPDGRARWLARFAGLLLAVAGAAQLFGALAGGTDPLQPLAGLRGGAAAQAAQAFRTVKSNTDLDRALAAARADGRPVLFDFYADWCVSCKEMERDTFTDAGVRAALADFVLLKADVTANDAVDQALMKRFGIIGPPATLFFRDAAERRDLRLVGFERADAFVARLKRVPAAR